MRPGLAIALGSLALLWTHPAFAEDMPPGIVLVTMAPARQGSLPDTLTAYGVAAPAQNGGMTISLQQDGRIAALLVTQGERVAARAPLIAFDVAPSSASAYTQALTAVSLAQTQRAHTAQLLAQRLATRDQLAQAEKAVSDAEATLAALTEQGGGRAHVQVTAPFDGIVETLPVTQGDRVAAGATLLTLTRTDGLVVTVGVEPALHDRVRPGQIATLRAMDGEASLDGRVVRIDGVVNPKTRLLDVDLAVPSASVISGQQYRAEIELGARQGWLVPHASVLEDEHGMHLFQANGSRAARVDVRVLSTRGDVDAVLGRLDGTRLVIVEGATQLADGDPVRTAP